MGKWMDGWMDEWMNKRVDGCTDRRHVWHTNGRLFIPAVGSSWAAMGLEVGFRRRRVVWAHGRPSMGARTTEYGRMDDPVWAHGRPSMGAWMTDIGARTAAPAHLFAGEVHLALLLHRIGRHLHTKLEYEALVDVQRQVVLALALAALAAAGSRAEPLWQRPRGQHLHHSAHDHEDAVGLVVRPEHVVARAERVLLELCADERRERAVDGKHGLGGIAREGGDGWVREREWFTTRLSPPRPGERRASQEKEKKKA
eukprot:363269-Chlamydomonas_euryale.AAC.13